MLSRPPVSTDHFDEITQPFAPAHRRSRKVAKLPPIGDAFENQLACRLPLAEHPTNLPQEAQCVGLRAAVATHLLEDLLSLRERLGGRRRSPHEHDEYPDQVVLWIVLVPRTAVVLVRALRRRAHTLELAQAPTSPVNDAPCRAAPKSSPSDSQSVAALSPSASSSS
jgi:hypothetical protein